MNPTKQFETQEAYHTARIADLSEERTMAEDELRGLLQEREAVLRDINGTGDVSALESHIEAVRKRVAALQERIAYAEEHKLQQLSGMLNDIEQQRQRDEKKKIAEYEDAIRTLNAKKLDYLAHAKRIGELVNEINAINRASNEYRNAAGANPIHHWSFESKMTIHANPTHSGFDVASWETLAIPDWLIREALVNKRLPAWKGELEVTADGKGK